MTLTEVYIDPGFWVHLNGKMYRRTRGKWITGKRQSRLLRHAFLRQSKNRNRRKVSPSTSRFIKRQGRIPW